MGAGVEATLEWDWEGLENYIRSGRQEKPVYKERPKDLITDFDFGPLSVQTEFLAFLEVMHEYASPEVREYIEEVVFKAFNVYFLTEGKNRKWKQYGAGVNDLPMTKEEAEEYEKSSDIMCELSPTRVLKMYQISSNLNWDEHEELFLLARKSKKKGYSVFWFREFERFKDYAQEWENCLKAAADINAGVSVYYYG